MCLCQNCFLFLRGTKYHEGIFTLQQKNWQHLRKMAQRQNPKNFSLSLSVSLFPTCVNFSQMEENDMSKRTVKGGGEKFCKSLYFDVFQFLFQRRKNQSRAAFFHAIKGHTRVFFKGCRKKKSRQKSICVRAKAVGAAFVLTTHRKINRFLWFFKTTTTFIISMEVFLIV